MFDSLIEEIASVSDQIKDHRKRPNQVSYSLKDCLMSGLAMFSLKDPSVLSFIENYSFRQENLESVFKISSVPSDSGLRKILDPVDPDSLQIFFKTLLESVDNKGLMSSYECLDGYHLLSIDGTGTFNSNEICCPNCMVKKRKKNGKVYHEYYHQLLVGCLVHPDHSSVFPVFGEAITKQDGSIKNDCERNACKRLLPKIRKLLPSQKLLVLLDGLYADGPSIKALKSHDMDYITVIKEGYTLVQVAKLKEKNALESHTWKKGKHIHCTAKWVNNLMLNGAHPDLFVNYYEYEEIDQRTGKVIYSNKWITSIEISNKNIIELTKIGRCRWKIENETFNTLKNHGYNLEHNYGHGKKNLSTNFALLMLLAFFVDQITKALDGSFEKALSKAKTLRDLRQKVRVLFDIIPAKSMNFIYRIIAREVQLKASQ